MGGRLQKFSKAWKGSPVERLISRGLDWSWISPPPPLQELHQHATPSLDLEVQKLLEKKAIIRTKNILGQSRLFTVPKKDSEEERLVMDLSWLNVHIKNNTFKMLTLEEVRRIIPKGYWTVSLDLKDGYLHLSVRKKLRPHLGLKYYPLG